MNPALEESDHEYMVLGFVWQATSQRPWIRYATKPEGLSRATWTDLQTAVFEGHYIRNKLFGTTNVVASCAIVLSLYALLGGNTNANEQEDQVDTIFACSLFFVVMFLFVSLEGAWHLSHVRHVIRTMQPVLQREGWKLQFHTHGKTIFFLIGTVTLQCNPYQAPEPPVCSLV